MTFVDCPRVSKNITRLDFWSLSNFSTPLIIPGDVDDIDFIGRFRTLDEDGDILGINSIHTRYILTNPPRNSTLLSSLRETHPIPEVVDNINLIPLISVGSHETGQTDLARHYHGITVMRLLQGQKVWALRPPDDHDCAKNVGTCTNPFHVCKYHKEHKIPCVQEVGDTIIIPDGWYHGTCNTAISWTVGWGGHNRCYQIERPKCDTCWIDKYYMSTKEDVFTYSEMLDIIQSSMERNICSTSYNSCDEYFVLLSPKKIEFIQLRFRSIFMQLFDWEINQALQIKSFMTPYCKVTRGNDTWLYSDDAYGYVPISEDINIEFKSHNATENIKLEKRKAVMWRNNSLSDISYHSLGIACCWKLTLSTTNVP